ncbi:MAG: 50S ribosomal protein L18 [Thermoanaerobacterales bacterium]|nr:50S ribosomal protein L18 [Thermoanaerobacterales bacterium]
MLKKVSRQEVRDKKRIRVRKKVFGTPERPRLNVFRSLNHIYAQLIDDESGRTLCTASTLSPQLKGKLKTGGDVEAARAVGELIARIAGEKGIKDVVFDRAGYLYHGRVKALAEGARAGGLQF